MPLGLLALAAAVLAIGSSGATFAAEPPPMSDPIVLDHGFRYEYNPGMPGRSTVAVGEGTVFFAYMDHDGSGRGFGVLHDPPGERAGWNPVEFFAHEDHARTFDCSDLDSIGWKLAYIGGVGMRVRNLHPTTLKPTGPDLLLASEVTAMRCPLIAKYAGGHVVLWIDGTDVWQTRVDAGLHAIDPSPRLLSTGAEWVALAMGGSGGIVVWKTVGDSLASLPLDENAFPTGNPTTIGPLRYGMFDVSSLGNGWLVASKYESKLELHRLDARGALVTTSTRTTHYANSPVSVCSSDSVGVVLWGDLWCTRVDTAGEPIGDAIRLDELAYVEYFDVLQFEWDPRAFACAWTGESFAMIWHEFAVLYTGRNGVRMPARPDADPAAGVPTYPGYDDVPVFAQWMDEAGHPLLTEPLLASQASIGTGVAPWTNGNRTIAIMRDDASDLWLHTLQLDTTGDIVGGPTRFRTPASEGHCGVWECSWSYISDIHVRPWGDDVACIYTENSGYSSQYSWFDSEVLIIDRVSMEGGHLLRAAVPIHSTGDGVVVTTGVDFAARQEDALAVYSTWENSPGRTRAVLLSPTGEHLRQWEFVADSSISRITTVPLTDGYLVAWSRREPGGPILRAAIIDPSMPESEISGAPLLGPGWRGWNCHLVPGLDQTLCVFTGRQNDDPSENRLYVVRIDETGGLIDSQPIRLTDDTCAYCLATGVWDSNHYLVVWRRFVPDVGADLYGSRIGRNGVLVDPGPFPLGQAGWPPNVSSDSLGNVTLGYDGGIRMIRDLVPLELQDPIFPDDDAEAAGDLRIGDVTPNPARGEVRLALKLPTGITARVAVHDAAGRRLHVAEIAGPFVGATPVWDGRLEAGRRAPAGVYFLRVEVGAHGESRKAFLLR